MIIRIATLLLLPLLLCQEARAVAFFHAAIDTIRGTVISIDTKTGFAVDGYIIEVEDDIDAKALDKVRKSLIANTRHDYRKFERPRAGQFLLLVLKTEKIKISVGDRVETKNYGVVNGSDNGPKDGNPFFKSFMKIEPVKK